MKCLRLRRFGYGVLGTASLGGALALAAPPAAVAVKPVEKLWQTEARGGGQNSTFMDFALVIGSGGAAFVLVFGVGAATAQVYRGRRRRLAHPPSLSRPRQVEVRTNRADLAHAPPHEVGDRIATILESAEEAADQIRREARETAAAIRTEAEKEAAAQTERLAMEIEEVKSEAQTRAQALRDQADGYAARRLREASEEVEKVLAEAEAQAQTTRAAAEEAAGIDREAHRREAALAEAIRGLEEGFGVALEDLEDLSTDLEEVLRTTNA